VIFAQASSDYEGMLESPCGLPHLVVYLLCCPYILLPWGKKDVLIISKESNHFIVALSLSFNDYLIEKEYEKDLWRQRDL